MAREIVSNKNIANGYPGLDGAGLLYSSQVPAAFLTTQSNQAVSAANGSSTFQTLSFANSNGVSFSTGTQGIYASVNAGGGAAISAGANSQNTGTINFANSNGITFGLSNNGTMTASHNGITQQSTQPVAYSAANGSANFSTLTFANSNGVSFSTGTQGLFASVNTSYRASNDAVGLNTAQSNVTWTVNSAGISLNAAGYAGTGLTLNVTNLSTSATFNSNGLNLSINNIDDHLKGFSLVGNTAGTNASTYTTTGQMYLSGGNNITLSGNSNTVVISGAAPGGTTFWSNSVFMHPPGAQYVGTSSVTLGNSSMYMQPFQLQNALSASYIRHLVSLPAFGQTSQATSASTVTADWYATFYANIFSNGVGANSKSLQLYSAATAGMTHRWLFTLNATGNSYAWQITFPFEGANTNNTGTSYTQTSASASWATTGQHTQFTGLRWLDIPFAQSMPPGQYWMQFQRSTSSATTGGNFGNTTALTSNMTVINITQASINANPFNSAANSTNGLQLGLGVYTTNSSGGTTASVPLNGISTVANQPVIPFQIIRQA